MSKFESSRKMTVREQTAYNLGFHEGRNAAVVHGHWISDEGDVLFHCSECETQISTSWDYDDLHWNYCPTCGARMGGEA